MSQISSVEGRTIAEQETSHLWHLLRDLADVKRRYCRTGTGAAEIRDELDLLSVMSDCPGVVRQARTAIAEIDRAWPQMAVA